MNTEPPLPPDPQPVPPPAPTPAQTIDAAAAAIRAFSNSLHRLTHGVQIAELRSRAGRIVPRRPFEQLLADNLPPEEKK